MKLSLGISPCPNDTFIFAPLIHGWMNTKGIEFDVHYKDVQALNESASREEYDLCKVSFAAYPAISDHYRVLASGAALGRGCGPLLVSKKNIYDSTDISGLTVGIPGKATTANALLTMAYPELKDKREIIFSEIEHRVLDETIELGLLIHEKRFTYINKGLFLLKDLGQWWEENTSEAIPLGCIAINRKLHPEIQKELNVLIRDSIIFSRNFPESVMPFVVSLADEMDYDVIRKHISLYVNDYSLQLGKGGIFASETFFKLGSEAGLFKNIPKDWLLNFE